MKRNIRTAAGVLAIAAVTLTAAACQDLIEGLAGSREIRFTSSLRGVGTRAAYSGIVSDGIERINWASGDAIAIYCPEANTTEDGAATLAHYLVTGTPSASGIYSDAHLALWEAKNDKGIRWQDGNVGHNFYGVYPSQVAGGCVSKFLGTVVTATVPIKQSYTLVSDENSPKHYTAVPDLNESMVMISKKENVKKSDGEIELDFYPVTTAITLHLRNAAKDGSDIVVKKVTLKSATKNLAGTFDIDIANLAGSTIPDIGNTASVAKSVYADFGTTGVTLAGVEYDPSEKEYGDYLDVTLFLMPVNETIGDLTLELVTDNGTLSTKLLNKTGAFSCVRCKKYDINGILIPEGAVWELKMLPTVDAWSSETSDLNYMYESVFSVDGGQSCEITLRNTTSFGEETLSPFLNSVKDDEGTELNPGWRVAKYGTTINEKTGLLPSKEKDKSNYYLYVSASNFFIMNIGGVPVIQARERTEDPTIPGKYPGRDDIVVVLEQQYTGRTISITVKQPDVQL